MRQENGRKPAPMLNFVRQGPKSGRCAISGGRGTTGAGRAVIAAVKRVFQAFAGRRNLSLCPRLVRSDA